MKGRWKRSWRAEAFLSPIPGTQDNSHFVALDISTIEPKDRTKFVASELFLIFFWFIIIFIIPLIHLKYPFLPVLLTDLDTERNFEILSDSSKVGLRISGPFFAKILSDIWLEYNYSDIWWVILKHIINKMNIFHKYLIYFL